MGCDDEVLKIKKKLDKMTTSGSVSDRRERLVVRNRCFVSLVEPAWGRRCPPRPSPSLPPFPLPAPSWASMAPETHLAAELSQWHGQGGAGLYLCAKQGFEKGDAER